MLDYVVVQMKTTNYEKGYMYYPVLERTIYCTQDELFTFHLLVSSFYVCFLAEWNTTRTMDDDRSLA